MILGHMKMRFAVEHGYVGSLFHKGFLRGPHATHKGLRGSHTTQQRNRHYLVLPEPTLKT
jgi:hypothetical protein